jgi:hypothetical protein
MEKQLSSLKWLRERLETYRQGEKNSQSYILIPTWKLETLMVIAEEMHKKEEVIKGYNQGYRDGEHDASNIPLSIGDISEYNNAENYYNQTYGGNK